MCITSSDITSPGHVQVYHSCLKKYCNNSTKSFDKYFMKNNHHLDFLQALFSASGIDTAFFTQKVTKLAKNRFSWLPWKRTG